MSLISGSPVIPFTGLSSVGAGLLPSISTKTAAYTITTSDFTILANAASAAFTITLPTPVNTNVYNIKKIDSSANAVTISGGGANIDGSATNVLASQFANVQIQGNGTQWYVI